MNLEKEDYVDPRCALCGKPGEEETVQPVPVGRIMDKLREYEDRNDWPAVERHLKYWLAEAEANRDERGQLMLNNELMGYYRKQGKQEQAFAHAEKAAALVEKHFGWRLLNDFSVRKVDPRTPLADHLLEFVKNCSWTEVKEHMAEKISKWEFSDWETMFVAMEDDQIIGIASALKEDYYPLPELFPWISTVFVSEGYRGLRVSEKLIAYANDYLRENGFNRSYIPSSHVGLYERYGYFYVKEITNYGGTDDHLYVKIIR